MTWYRSDLAAGGSVRALYHGHPGKMAQLVITASIWVGRLTLSTAEARYVVVDVDEIETWCLMQQAPAPTAADVAWLVGGKG